MSCPVLGRHQRQLHQLGPGQFGTHRQVRGAVALGIAVLGLDADLLVQGLATVQHHHRGHQLGQRGNGQHRRRILVIQDLAVSRIHHQRHAGTQCQRIRDAVQTGCLAQRTTGNGRQFRCTGRKALVACQRHRARTDPGAPRAQQLWARRRRPSLFLGRRCHGRFDTLSLRCSITPLPGAHTGRRGYTHRTEGGFGDRLLLGIKLRAFVTNFGCFGGRRRLDGNCLTRFCAGTAGGATPSCRSCGLRACRRLARAFGGGLGIARCPRLAADPGRRLLGRRRLSMGPPCQQHCTHQHPGHPRQRNCAHHLSFRHNLEPMRTF